MSSVQNSKRSLDSRLAEILFWLRESKRMEEIQEHATSESTSTAVNFTTMSSIWNITENSTSPIQVVDHRNQGFRVSLMMFIVILMAILAICCIIGLMAWCRNRRNQKSTREPDEEGRIDFRHEDGIRHCQFRFWFPEMAATRREGFVSLSEKGEVTDVKYWTMEQLDDYFKAKCFKSEK